MNPRQRFEANLPLVERLLASVASRNGMFGDDAAEFASWARLRLIDNDYAVLAKFRGRARFTTYLNTVVHNLFRDYRTHKWGKWRPSAAARRLGDDAVLLETLVHRDGHEGSTAIRIARENFGVGRSQDELEQLLGSVAGRPPRQREVSDAALERVGHLDGTESRVKDQEKAALAQAAEAALAAALAQINAEDRLILQLRFEQGWTLAKVARSLRLDQKGLYRRVRGLMTELRVELEARGVDRTSMERLIGWPELDLSVELGDEEPPPSPAVQV